MTDPAMTVHYAGGHGQDSFLTNCTSLLPEVKATWNHATETRIKLSAKIAGGKLDAAKEARAKAMVAKLEKLGASDSAPVIEGTVEKMQADYEKLCKDMALRYASPSRRTTSTSHLTRRPCKSCASLVGTRWKG